MIVLRCTQRLLKNSGVSAVAEEPPAPDAPLGEWYANVVPLPFPGRSAVMYTSASTLLTVVAPGRMLRTTLPVFERRLPALLARLGLPEEWAERHRPAVREPVIARTANRRVLGSMNDLANGLWYGAAAWPSWEGVDLDTLEARLAETPLGLLGMRSPDAATAALARNA